MGGEIRRGGGFRVCGQGQTDTNVDPLPHAGRYFLAESSFEYGSGSEWNIKTLLVIEPVFLIYLDTT